jgi:hypothetical protein
MQPTRASNPRSTREMFGLKAASPKPTKARVNRITTRATNQNRHPYFIQFICREVFDIVIQRLRLGESIEDIVVPIDAIVRKLDSDFFSGRWAKPTDRQRELLSVIAQLEKPDGEFTVQEIVTLSGKLLKKPFSSSHVNQMLATLGEMGLIYKNRYGRYSFAVPLFGEFIIRQMERDDEPPTLFE